MKIHYDLDFSPEELPNLLAACAVHLPKMQEAFADISWKTSQRFEDKHKDEFRTTTPKSPPTFAIIVLPHVTPTTPALDDAVVGVLRSLRDVEVVETEVDAARVLKRMLGGEYDVEIVEVYSSSVLGNALTWAARWDQAKRAYYNETPA